MSFPHEYLREPGPVHNSLIASKFRVGHGWSFTEASFPREAILRAKIGHVYAELWFHGDVKNVLILTIEPGN